MPSTDAPLSFLERLRLVLGEPSLESVAAPAAPHASEPGALDASFRERFPLEILVVEDNKLNLKMAQALLARLGYGSESATNGVEAVQAVARKRFDLVLMDVQMPVMDGLAATRQIRARFGATGAPRVVAMTAAESPDEHQQCVAAGMVGLVAKPVRLEDLAEVLAGAAVEGRAPNPRADGAPIASSAASQTFDLTVLRERLGAVGEAGVRAELAAVLGRAPAAVDRIARALASANASGAASAAEELGSSAARLGASALARSAAEVARRLGSEASSATDSAFADLVRAARDAQRLADAALESGSGSAISV